MWHEDVDRFGVRIRGHEFEVDQPDSGDAAPTPTELFVASLASCVAFYAGRLCTRHGVDPTGLGVTCERRSPRIVRRAWRGSRCGS